MSMAYREQEASFQRTRGVFTVVLAHVVLILSGCVVPISSGSSVGEIETARFDNLIGDTIGDIRSEFGEPTYVLHSQNMDETYYIYSGYISGRLELGVIDIFDAHTVGSIRTGSSTLCYLFVFDSDEKLARHDARRGKNDFCPDYFWSEKEVRALLASEAARGDRQSASVYARIFQDVTYLVPFANRNDFSAAVEIAGITGNLEFLRNQAAGGNTKSAFALYVRLKEDRNTYLEAWEWLCVAANGRHGEAQERVGHWHRSEFWRSESNPYLWLDEEIDIQPSNELAHMWYTLAKSSGYVLASRKIEFVEEAMTPDEISNAKRLADSWGPGDCPSSVNRLNLPGH